MKSKIANKEWKKVVYEEADGQVNIKQGYFLDEGDFVRLNGTYAESLIRKDKIVSITSKHDGEQDGTTSY